MRKIMRRKVKTKTRLIILGVFLILIIMAGGYAAFNTQISLHVKGNIKYNSKIIQAWDTTSQTDFHSDYYRENIVSATFVNNNDIPESAVESWNVSEDKGNVSEDKENGEVMAWVVPNSEDSSKYDLYIGTKGKVIANENSAYVFDGFSNMKSITFNDNFDTSNATDMHGMFRRESNLTNLDLLSSFDTSNVTNMGGMFSDNFALETVNLSSFDTSDVTNMAWMFSQCHNLTGLDLSTFDTRNVTDMKRMFSTNQNIEFINFGNNFYTNKVTDMSLMFLNCSKLKELDLSTFYTSNVTNMQKMFNNCEELTELDLSSFDTRNVTDMTLMFSGNDKLTIIYVGQNFITDNADTTGMFNMFSGNDKLTIIYVGQNFITDNADTTGMFNACGTSQVTQK